MVTKDGFYRVSFAVHGPAMIGLGQRSLRARDASPRDLRIMEALHLEERRRDAAVVNLHQAHQEAYGISHKADLLKTSYKTRGKKERQEVLFPELVEEIQKETTNRPSEILWPDQNAEAYKDEVERLGTPLLGPKLS